MNLSALDVLIQAADTKACIDFFASMPEAKRKTFAARAMQWTSAINGYSCRSRRQYLALVDKTAASDLEFYDKIQNGAVAFPRDFTDVSTLAARAAVLASCSFAEIKRAKVTGLPDAATSISILLSRKPGWTSSWCSFVLKEFPATHWLAAYRLEQASLCSIERNADYWMSMLCSMPNINNALESVLLADEQVRLSVWDMLAEPAVMRMLAEPEAIAQETFRKRWRSGGNIFGPVVGGRQVSDWWLGILNTLASKNLLDRNKLIDFSFSALTNESEKESKKSPYAPVSSADFAIKLNQALLEHDYGSYKSRFTALLSAAHKEVSTYASTALASLPLSELDVSEICSCIAPAFLIKNKEPADAALKLLAKLAKQTVCDTPNRDFGVAVLSALNHSSKDIHKKTLTLIETTNILEDSNLRNEYSQRLDVLAGIERTLAVKLLAKYEKIGADGGGNSVANTSTSSDTNSSGEAKSACLTSDERNNRNDVKNDISNAIGETASLESLAARMNELDQLLCKLSGVEKAISLAKDGQVFESTIELNGLDFPRLNRRLPVKTIDNLDDLIYTYMKVWGGKATASELELVLDGVSRLCCERPPGFEEKIEVLRQRARSVVAQEFPNFGWSNSMAHLVFCWVGESSPVGLVIGSDTSSFYMRRALAVAKRAANKIAAPLLAAPTHPGFWIEPEALVKKLLEYQWRKIEPDNVDFIQALLRLAPDGRINALSAADNINGEIGDALRFALGANNRVRMTTPEYWVAAYRAREPRGTSQELRVAFPGLGPDGTDAAAYGFDIEPIRLFNEDRYSSISAGLPNFLPLTNNEVVFKVPQHTPGSNHLMVQNQVAQAKANRARFVLFPTIILHDTSNSWFVENQSTIWLHNRESLLALTAKRILQNIESIGSYWHGEFEFLFDPDISLDDNGRYVICMAMSSKNSDFSRLALDVLIGAVAECRISPVQYGESMANVFPAGVITPVRWVRGIRDIARVSALHAWFAWRAISTLITRAEMTPLQQIPFLELLVELQVEHHYQIDSELHKTLAGITGGSKSVKLAKLLLTSTGIEKGFAKAALQNAEARLRRVERWQSWKRTSLERSLV